jgi:hypothetical protein
MLLTDYAALLLFGASVASMSLAIKLNFVFTNVWIYISVLRPCIYVWKVISPERSLDRFPDPRRALIGGACRLWQWAPPRAAPYKR